MKRKYLRIIFIVLFLLIIAVGVLCITLPLITQNCTAGDVDKKVLKVEPEYIEYEIPKLQNSQPEQQLRHLAYTVSYNPKWRIPNWVAYELTDVEVNGTCERSDHFRPDPLVKRNPVITSDYTRSGYDRGHMAPAGDMKWSEQAMQESFYMTNICPQNHSLNAGDWKDLEEMARDWAQKYGSIYIACGPLVNADYSTIGTERKIAVPDAFYKVFLRNSSPGGWTAIGFVMPNQAGSRPIMTYMKTVDEVEQLVGIDFFCNLPDSIEEQVESDISLSDWLLSRH